LSKASGSQRTAAHRKQRHPLAQAVFALLATNPGLLVSTEWHVRVKRVRAIDPYRTRMQLVCNLECARDILRKNRGSQTVQRVVRLAQYVGFVLKLDYNANRPENLLLDNAHVWPSVGENSRLDPVTLCSMSPTSKVDLGALLLARIDVAHDALHYFPSANSKISNIQRERHTNVELDLGYLRTLVRIATEWVSELNRLGLGSEALKKLIVDVRLDKDARAGSAALPVVEAGRGPSISDEFQPVM
jgi:hypothetical protein